MSPTMFDVRGFVVVVTGGLGQLGRSYSKALTDCGARVAIVDNQLSKVEASEFGLCVPGDVTNLASLREALSIIEARLGTPRGLINNAAIDTPADAPSSENGPYESYPVEEFDRIMDVNAKGVHLCCQVFGSRMAEKGLGSIINVSSIYGMVSPNQKLYEYRRRRGENFYKPIAYSVSKSAVLNMSRYLATYWGGAGVRVNTITLGGVFNGQDKEFVDEYSARVPLGRMAQPEDYSGAIIFLLSDASAYMTGANLVMDGGWTAW